MENKNLLSVPDDHYSAAIDFSNACREFYINRVRATESFKEQMKEEEKSKHERPLQRKRSSIDIAMETLRKEMVRLEFFLHSQSERFSLHFSYFIPEDKMVIQSF